MLQAKLIQASRFLVVKSQKISGDIRVEWLLRCYGLFLLINLLFQHRTPTVFLQTYPWSFLTLGVAGALIIFFGARLWLMVVCAVAGWCFLIQESISPFVSGLDLQAAEYPVFPLVPTVFLLGWWLTRSLGNRADECFEMLMLMFFRWLTLSILFWVSFHKVNSDFLGTSGSCEEVLKVLVAKRWDGWFLTWLASLSNPVMVVLFEGTVSILLLLLAPRLGVLFVCVFFSFVSLLNALVVTLCVIVGSAAFLTREDRVVLRQHWRSCVGYWLLTTVFCLLLSSVLYKERFLWYLNAMHHVVVITLMFAAGFCQMAAWKKAWKAASREEDKYTKLKRLLRALRDEQIASDGAPALFTEWAPGNMMLFGVILVLTLNGASPYLGWKFEYSFAMLSNLRVDDARWNHLLVPRWVRLTKHDAFVHLNMMQVKLSEPSKLNSLKGIIASLYSPWVVVERLEGIRKAQPSASIELDASYQGQPFKFKGRADAEELRAWVASLSAKNRLFQNQLAIEGPQGCCH